MWTFIKDVFTKAAPPLLVISAVFFLYLFTDVFETQTPPPQPVATTTPSQFPDYDAYLLMEKRLEIAVDRESYSPKDKPIIGRIKKTLETQGEFSRAYIYVEASVDNGKPLTQWDSIYMTLGYIGGQLQRTSSLKVPDGEITKVLFGLNQIPFTTLPYSENNAPTMKDWFALISKQGELNFDAFLSTLRPGGKINRIEIRYQCEINSDCFIRETI